MGKIGAQSASMETKQLIGQLLDQMRWDLGGTGITVSRRHAVNHAILFKQFIVA
jgi:hypothetical protein